MVLVACGMRAAGDTADVSGYIGSHKLTFKCQSIAKEAKFPLKGPADYLAVTEVYPDTPQVVIYSYRISGSGIGSYERRHKSLGFGPVTYFLRVRNAPLGTIKITNHATGSKARPVLISSVWTLVNSDLKSRLEWDRFTLMGLVPGGTQEERDRWVGLLSKNLGSRPDDHINTGFSSEIYYCNRDRENVKQQLAACAAWARQYKMPAMLGLVSWWGGTPLWIDDGLGGKFGDVTYQQVCFSPEAQVPENADLRKLLGDRYSRNYGLSVPNQWSNCPWLTMNSPVLNAYRFKRLAEAVALLKEVSAGSSNWIKGIFLENEPRYWDSDCEAGNPKSDRKILWADFNPAALADAKKDGVILDPSDGLSDGELAWLHRNVGRYNQDTVNAVKKALAAQKFGQNLPLYTHSLQLRHMFPGGTINHPASEWAHALGARSGIEGLWSQPSDFQRVREWGGWTNLNREENDGQSIEGHLWDLRVAYMMGSDLYNSYNWHAIGAERFFDYVKEFMAQFPIVSLPPADAHYVDRGSIKIKTPMKLQAFSRVEIPVKIAKKIKGCIFLGVAFDTGEAHSSQQQPIDLAPGQRTLAIDFATPAECPWNKEALLVLYVFDAKGRLAQGSVVFAPESGNGVKLILDLRTQRALSLAVIDRAKRLIPG